MLNFIKYLLVILAITPINIFGQSKFDKGVLFFENDEFEKAITIFENLLENANEADSILLIEAYLASSNNELDKIDDAVYWANRVLSKDSLNRIALMVHFRKGVLDENNSKVVKYSTMLINEHDEKEDFLFYYRGMSLFNLGEFNLAIDDMNKVYKSSPNLPSVNYFLGLFHHHVDNLEQAILYFKKSIELDYKLINSYYNIGLSNFHLKNYQNAIENINKARKLDSTETSNHERFSVLGISYYYIDDFDSAVYYLEKVPLEGNDYHEEFMEELLFSYYKIEALDSAIKYAEDLLNKYPEKSYLYNALAKVYAYHRMDTTKALHYLEKGLELKKRNILEVDDTLEYYCSTAVLFAVLGKMNRALEINSMLLESSPDSTFLYRHRVYLLDLVDGNDSEIQALYDKLINHYSKNNEDEKTAFYYVKKAGRFSQTKDLNHALKDIENAIALDSLNDYLLYKLKIKFISFVKDLDSLSGHLTEEYVKDFCLSNKDEFYDLINHLLSAEPENIEYNKIYIDLLLLFGESLECEKLNKDEICKTTDNLDSLGAEYEEKIKHYYCDGLDVEYLYTLEMEIFPPPPYEVYFDEPYPSYRSDPEIVYE